MAWELESLIAGLLVLISCAGEQGCLVSEVLDSIRDNTSAALDGPDVSDVSVGKELRNIDSTSQRRTASAIWAWLANRRDIAVGLDRVYNHLTLDELSNLPASSYSTTLGKDEQSPGSLDSSPDSTALNYVRVYASEETMWESITGHAVDHKRVPKSEWILLLGIASTKSQGILQGDLGRLVEQDKRSVPKRTDSLVRKGYIIKRTTLVRGTKTSKLWLRQFAPPLPKDFDEAEEPRAEVNINRQILTQNLDAVPWHTRWTGESIDYTALATTIMAIAKEWGVLRMQDLKAKLGVLGLRWQMKVLSKVCRFLNARGVIQYVAAKLGDKVFKDCVKYGRELGPDDWAAYLATGKRTAKLPKSVEGFLSDSMENADQMISQNTNATEMSTAPPWSADKPLAASVAELARHFGDGGMSNPDVYGLTLGPSFSRYLSSMTTALSTPSLQPPHLRHLQLSSEHTRSGKVASYRYFIKQLRNPSFLTSEDPNSGACPEQGQLDASSTGSSQNYGFGGLPAQNLASSKSSTLFSLCEPWATNPRARGRPKKSKAKPPPKAATINREHEGPISPISQDPAEASFSATEEPVVVKLKTQEAPRVSVKLSMVVTMKLAPAVLRDALGLEAISPLSPPTSRPQRIRSSRNLTDHAEPSSTIELQDENTPTEEESVPKKRGQGRKSGKRSDAAESRPWKCEKCGGSWKNDIGLKYHVEKSRTPCNPSYDEATQGTPRKGGRKPASFLREALASSTTMTDDPMAISPPAEKEDTSKSESDPSKIGIKSKSKASTPTPRAASRNGLKVQPRLSNGLVGDFRQTTLEWRRPSVTSLDKSNKNSIPKENESSALLQGQHSQPRQVLTPSKVRNLVTSSQQVSQAKSSLSKEIASDQRPEHDQGDTITLSADREPRVEQGSKTVDPQHHIEPSDVVDDCIDPMLRPHETPLKHINRVEPPFSRHDEELTTPMKQENRKRIPRAVIYSQVQEVIQSILSEQNGAFPGEKVLWHAFNIRWNNTFAGQAVPTNREYNLALSEMLKKKIASENWHAFRDRKGMFSKCQVIVQKNIDPFSAYVMGLVQRIKDSYPQPYYPFPFTAPDVTVSHDDAKRGRRLLPSEVEVLSAPVYAAQMTAKRGLDADDAFTPSKRLRRAHSSLKKTVAGRGSYPFYPQKKQVLSWNNWSHAADYNGNEYEDPNTYGPFLANASSEEIQFLAPNTHLDDEPSSPEDQYTVEGDAVADGSSTPEIPKNITFGNASQISGSNGSWPCLRTQEFEADDTSYTLNGWMPDTQWYAWAEMAQGLDKRASMAGSMARSRETTDDGKYYRLMDRLMACLEIESAWSESFINARKGAAGPHNILINFSSGPLSGGSLDNTVITWPAECQYTRSHFATLTRSSDTESDFEIELQDQHRNLMNGWEPPSEVGTPSAQRYSLASYGQWQRNKRVTLATRNLTALAPTQSDAEDVIREPEKVLAGFVAVRVLLGGADKAVDWGLLMQIFPDLGLTALRRFWHDARKEQGPRITNWTRDFQEMFLSAYEEGEIPELDFDKPSDYNWHELIEWMIQLRKKEDFHLPSTRSLLCERLDMFEMHQHEEDTLDKFFHVQSSVYARFEAVTSDPAAVPIKKFVDTFDQQLSMTNLDVARSWIKSLCCTVETKYSVEQVKEKFLTLVKGDDRHTSMVLKQAIDDLTRRRVICRSKRPPLGGRPYRLNEWYTYMLGKLSQRAKYRDAAMFKARLDDAFRREGRFTVPYMLEDGAVMALTNLNASRRIRIVSVDAPHIPFGFEPGNYESRKFPKSYYHFTMQAVPTETYLYDDQIEALAASARNGPPLQGPSGEVPQWVDFFGAHSLRRWSDVLGAFCFAYATRGPMTVEAVCSTLKPIIEPYEARIIIEWGKKIGVVKEALGGFSVTVGEWWWLVVPWQLK